MNRKHKTVIVMAYGASLAKLTAEEKEYINQCEAVIGLNMYTAFFNKVGVPPTHALLLDSPDDKQTAVSLIVQSVRKNKLKVTFVLRNLIRDIVAVNDFDYFKKQSVHKLKQVKKFLSLKRKPLGFIKDFFTVKYVIRIPRGCKVEFCARTHHLTGGPWATSLDQPLYMFRTTLTALLNYVSIKYPGYPIYMVGTDLTSGKSLFQEEIDAALAHIPKIYDDIQTKKNDLYFPAQVHLGKSVFDCLPFVVSELKKTNKDVFCISEESALVTKGFFPFKKLPIGS